ncbi:MAG: VanZ family protein [Brevundimonas sp.]
MRLLLRLAGAVVLVVLLALMLAPGGSMQTEELMWDKAAHFIAFGLILWSFGVMFRRLPRIAAAVLAIALGAAVEAIQGHVGRDPSWADLLADALGVATALLIWVAWRRFRPRRALQTSNTL